MAGLNITVEGTEELSRRILELGQDAPRAATRAINRTLSALRTATVRALAKETGLQATRVRRSVGLRRATWTQQVGTLTVSGRKIPLIAFGARQIRPGVSYRSAQGRTVLRSGFLATMKIGHRGVFLRAGKARLPIKEQFGPSLPGAFIERQIDQAMLQKAQADLVRNLDHEIRFILTQRVAAGDGAEDAA